MVREKRGFLLLEMLVAVLLLMGLVSLIVPTIGSVQEDKITRQYIVERLALERMAIEQFQAQFARIGRHGCYVPHRFIDIGDNAQAPPILADNNLSSGSDWIKAQDTGLCSTYGIKHGQRIDATLACDGLNAADVVEVSNCTQSASASILSTKNDHLIALSTTSEALEGPVLLATKETFYWYLASGRSEGMSTLWRKPLQTGRATELQANITHMRLYPIKDRDHDGVSDELVTRPSHTLLAELEGVLVEFRYQLSPCQGIAQRPQRLQYHTLRGDQWQYDNVCSAVAKVLVDLGSA